MYNYGGTLTFDSNLNIDQKLKIINDFPFLLSKNLRHFTTSEYYLKYSIEYHKVGIESDPEAPHIHFILTTSKQLPGIWFRNVQSFLKEIGRSQFYLMTMMKNKQYTTYIQKDVEENNRMNYNGLYHYIELYLEPVQEVLDVEDYLCPQDEYDDL